MIRRKSRITKKRGTRTCGWGTGKKHRGKGSRAGCGHGGVGKRGGQKKTYYNAHHIRIIGKIGFKNRIHQAKARVISIKNLDQRINNWVSQKLAEKKNDVYHIDLSKVKYDKIVSGGETAKKFEIVCNAIALAAREKIEAAGGKVTLSNESVVESGK